MATVTVFSGTADGRIDSSDASYANARAGTGTLTAATANQGIEVGQQSTFHVYIGYFNFDFSGSGVSAGAVISNAVLSFCLLSDTSNDDFTIEARTYDWGATLTTADFVAGANLSAKTLLASLTTAGISTGLTNYNALTANGTNLNDAIAAALAVDGILRVLVCSSRTTNNTTPTQNEYVQLYAADQFGSSSDPKLVFDWASVGQPTAKRFGGIPYAGARHQRSSGVRGW